jgi:hypothetical protein
LQHVHSCFVDIVCWCELLRCICGTRWQSIADCRATDMLQYSGGQHLGC